MPGNCSQEKTQLLARQLLVVDDDGAERIDVGHAEILAGSISSGMTMRTHVPSPGTLSSWS